MNHLIKSEHIIKKYGTFLTNMSFSPLPYPNFLGEVSKYMAYRCGCNYTRVHGYLPCLGGCSLRYVDTETLAPTKTASRPKKQQKWQDKVVPLSPYQRRDALLSKWYDEYIRDQYFDAGKQYLWVDKDCGYCQARSHESAFRPFLETMRIKYREDYELMMLRKEKQDRENEAKRAELELLRAEKRAREEVEELEFASDEDVEYAWANDEDDQ